MSPIVRPTTEPRTGQLTMPCLCWVTSSFNSCDITGLLPDLHQSVTGPTRLNKTIDMCFSNIPDAFRSLCKVCRPPLGRSGHNVVHLVPKYRQLLKREKPQTRRVPIWDDDSSEALKECFDCTDWQVLIDSCCVNPDELADTICPIFNFVNKMLFK